MKRARFAFTLTELLTALAVIGIVAAIVLPVVARAREGGRKTTCASNLRQLGLAFAQYVADYDGQYPDYLDYETSEGVPASWDVVVGVYAKNVELLQCPTDDTSPHFSYPGKDRAVYRSYAYAYNVAKGGNVMNPDTTHETAIPSPARTVLLVEGVPVVDAAQAKWNTGQFAFDLGEHVAWRHSGAANFLFADGHVKTVAGGAGAYPRFGGYPFDESGSLCGDRVPLP